MRIPSYFESEETLCRDRYLESIYTGPRREVSAFDDTAPKI